VATALGLYAIRIRGRLGLTALSAFPSMASELKAGETVLTGPLQDRAALFGVLAQIEALGLDLLELRRITAQAQPHEPGDERSAGWPVALGANTTVRHNPRLSRYEIAIHDGDLAGVALYQRYARRIAFLRTEIDPRHEGAGLAADLVRAALDDVRELGLEVVPVCPFVAAYIRSHADEYLDLVVAAMREPLVEDGRPI